MRYLVWKLIWPDGKYGIGPEQIVADQGARLEASSWFNPSVEQGEILGYLTGDVDLSLISQWSVRELIADDALAFAKSINDKAFIADNGVITAPREEVT